MAERKPSQEDVFDVGRVRDLIELMKEHDLSEIVICDGDKRMKLKRGADPAPAPLALPPAPIAAAVPVPTMAAPSNPGATPPADDANTLIIKSPMVGTFYSRPKPDAEPFVKVGDHVSPDSPVCIIEAMKVFNEIPAECTGKIVAVLLEDEQSVDVDKPLFKVDIGG